MFVRDGSLWTQHSKLVAYDGGADQYYGRSAAVSGDTAVVGGAPLGFNGTDSGAAYMCGVAKTYASTYCSAKTNSLGGSCQRL